ncbi:MAG: 23S rRNA (guanosine(2251)-2'-O)-methyltransferase RlmB [Deltaproteobacteria bacterium]|nr:23S rRNA (guanosine(2251)-2'-O)-methyltransferase RlmB [Deltaproteobacteria bacterium]
MRIIYGINPVAEALRVNAAGIDSIAISDVRSDKQLGEITKAARNAGVRVETRQARKLDEAALSPGHQGVVAFMRSAYAYRNLDELIGRWKKSGQSAFILILDSIQDPQNLGALVRSAVAAGAHGIIIPKDRAAEVTPAVVKASAGATEHACIARVVNITAAIAELKEEGVWVAGLAADSTKAVYDADFKGDTAVVVGAEGTGMRRLVAEACDYCVSIPMAGEFDSLNAATAGAIALFEAVRQRRGR